jgi:hypothetical protein
MTVNDFVFYVQQNIAPRVWQCSHPLQLRGIIEYHRLQEDDTTIFPVNGNLLLKQVHSTSYCFLFTAAIAASENEEEPAVIADDDLSAIAGRDDSNASFASDYTAEVASAAAKHFNKPQGKKSRKTRPAESGDTRDGGQQPTPAVKRTCRQARTKTNQLREQEPHRENSNEVAAVKTSAQSNTRIIPRASKVEDLEVVAPPLLSARFNDAGELSNHKEMGGSVPLCNVDMHKVGQKRSLPMLCLSQQTTKRTREAIPPPEIEPTVPQVGSKYFYCWRADHVDYEVQVIKKLSRYRVLIKFIGYPENETISVQQLLPHTQERVEAFSKARRDLSERDQEAREQARAEAKERRIEEHLKQQQAKEKRLAEEKEERYLQAKNSFGRGRLKRHDIPQDNGMSQPGQTVRLSKHRIVYFAKEDETAAIIADSFKVDVDLLLFDNQVAYPGITAKRKLYEYTSLVINVIE